MLEDKNFSKTPISKLGEFGLIEHLTQDFPTQQPSTVKGIGDDACILNSEGKKTLISTHLLAEGVHFNLGYVPLKHLGYKSVVINLSNLAAMNVSPSQILVSVAVSNRFTVEALEELYEGIRLACQRYKIDLVASNTTSSTSGLVINITAIGFEDEYKIVRRDRAQENDLLVVTGDLGSAYFGLQILEREHQVYLANPSVQPVMEGYDYILERQLKPEARTDIKKILEDLDIHPTSMIDISDGLASEVLHLSKQSQVGFRVYEEKIPLDPQCMTTADELNINPITAALNGGEDYELLFTMPQNQFDRIRNHPDFSVIGHAVVLSEGNHLVARGSNQIIPLTAQGWDAVLNKN